MPRSPRTSPDDLLRPPSQRVPFPFILDEIEPLDPVTRPMFGCLAVYVGDRIVFILRDKPEPRDDNGLWVALSPDGGASLAGMFPDLRPVGVLGDGGKNWLNLPAECDAFEEDALRLCALVRGGDLRIGKIPKPRGRSAPRPSRAAAGPVQEQARAKKPKGAGKPKASGAGNAAQASKAAKAAGKAKPAKTAGKATATKAASKAKPAKAAVKPAKAASKARATKASGKAKPTKATGKAKTPRGKR